VGVLVIYLIFLGGFVCGWALCCLCTVAKWADEAKLPTSLSPSRANEREITMLIAVILKLINQSI